MSLEDFLKLVVVVLTILTPIIVGMWRLFLFPLNQLKSDFDRVKGERNDEINLRKDLRQEYEQLNQKHEALVTERNATLEDRAKKMQTMQTQIEDLETALSEVDRQHTNTIEAMNEKMEGRYERLQGQLDESSKTAEKEYWRIENAYKFLVNIPGLNSDQVDQIFDGKLIWEDCKDLILKTLKIHDTEPLDPSKLPPELAVQTISQTTVQASTVDNKETITNDPVN